MSEQTIQSQDISVAAVFQAFYAVPDYQREYVWQSEQVEQLLTDINRELAGAEAAKAPEYFIGSIVVCPAKDGVLELIDGQQRMTTLFLTLCAIRDRLVALSQPAPGALGPQIAAVSTDSAGKDVFRYRLDLQYEDSGDVLEHIAEGKSADGEAQTLSTSNIRNAYVVALAFLKREFSEDTDAVRAFYGYLTNKVKLIRIQTEDVAKALKIFETINDRGVGLNSMDLLKNLLFMRASRDQFDKLKNTWKELQDTIFAMGEKPLRFLRYFIFSRYDVDVLREDEIYSWLAKNEKVCGYSKDPIAFAKELLSASQAYQNFLEGSDQKGKKSRFLENMQLLGGKAARQHLILLLAGRQLTETQFQKLVREVENMFFVYVVTREPTRDFERNFALWAKEIRAVKADTDLDAVIAGRFTVAKHDLAVRFDDAMRRLYSDSVQGYRLLYMLAKLTQHVELAAYGETESTKWLSAYTKGGYEIEHIFPQTPSEEAIAEFGERTDPRVEQRLGNLVLVEKSINGSLGKKAYSQKRPVYGKSQLLLTRSLGEKMKVGVNTKIDAAVAHLEPYEKWDAAAVDKRQGELAEMARRVWEVPGKEAA